MICRGCNKDKKLVKAHIIPESFFRELKKVSENTLFQISNVKGSHRRRAPIGVYDKEILCHDCEENIFKPLDDYAAKVLLNTDSHEVIEKSGETIGYRVNNLNNYLLKLFFISVLWRSAISNKDFYKNVSLGSLEKKAKELIFKKISDNKHDFSFLLAKFDDTVPISKTILNPHQERWFGVRYYRFYIASYVLYIKADSQKTPNNWAKFIQSDGCLNIFSRGKLIESKEYPLLAQIVKANKKF